MSQDITAADHFCGAGGASIGLVAAGARVTDGANHWKAACDVYGRNNPQTRVHCADLTATDPRRFPRTDLAWFSPECRVFSQSAPPTANRAAELFDDSEDSGVARSRVSMNDVIRFTDYHRYEVVMVENVVEVTRKFPIDWWYAEMCKLGYDFKVLSINSMVCWPTPQSRDRWYACFWRTGNPAPDYEVRPRSWCPNCEADVEAYQWWKKPPAGDPRAQAGKYRQQYLFKCSRCQTAALPYVWPALSALDLSLPCPRIGDRAKPLAEATRRRIEVGLERYGPGAIVQGAGNCFEREGYYRTWPLWRPLGTLTGTSEYGLAVNTHHAGSLARYDATRVYPLDGPLPTQTGQPELGLMVPLDHGETGASASVVDWPIRTQTGRAENGVVIVPMRTHNNPRDPGEPLSPLTTSHGGGHVVVELPYLVDGGKGTHPAQPATGPGQAVTGWGSQFLVTLRNHGEARPLGEPVGSLSAQGNHHGLLVRMNGGTEDAGPMGTPWEHPAGTITGAGNQAVVPFLTAYHTNGRPGSSSACDPMPTQLARDHHALVEPRSIEVDDCGFRMLEPHEAGRAMAFPREYLVDGSKRTRVRLYGQAVTPPVSAHISGRSIDSLAG